jgi:hypothetical protein
MARWSISLVTRRIYPNEQAGLVSPMAGDAQGNSLVSSPGNEHIGMWFMNAESVLCLPNLPPSSAQHGLGGHGRIAQLGEHRPYKTGVAGSSPAVSTSLRQLYSGISVVPIAVPVTVTEARSLGSVG